MTYKKEVKKKYIEVARKMKINAPILQFSRNKLKNASTYPQKIVINKGLAKLVFQDPELVETIIAHELTHYKNQDSYVLKKCGLMFSKKGRAINLVIELRASIAGYTFNGMKTVEEILNIEKRFKHEKYITNKRLNYRRGYPTSEQIAFYASSTTNLTENIAKEILNNYCSVMGIKNRKHFINDVLKITMNKSSLS